MNIVHIAQYYNDGFGYHENLLPEYQRDLGHKVTIITSYRKSPGVRNIKLEQEVSSIYENNGININRIPSRFEFKDRFLIFNNLYNELEKTRPDYIFHHGLTSPSILEAIRYKKKHPSVFLAADCHADFNNSGKNYIWRLIYYYLAWKNILYKEQRYIDIVFGVSPARCYFAKDILGIDKSLIRLLPMGADIKTANKILANNRYEKEPMEKRFLNIVTGGKWSKEKELEKLIIAIKGLPVKLEIFGIINDIRLRNLIINNHQIKFTGWQSREGIFKRLQEADLAIWNKFHTTLIEDAIALMKPIIIRFHGSTSHLIRGNGLYLFSGELQEINYLLRSIIYNCKIIDFFYENAKIMRNLLSYEKIAKESVDYYYDRSPKAWHLIFLTDLLCFPLYDGWR